MLKHINTLLLHIGLMISVASCSFVENLKLISLSSNNKLQKVGIIGAHDVNLNTAVALDILFIQDTTTAEALTRFTAKEWFERKHNLLLHFGNKLRVVNYEITPLSKLNAINLPKGHSKAHSILLFANYYSKPGQAVAELKNFRRLTIHLKRTHYQLLEEEKDKR